MYFTSVKFTTGPFCLLRGNLLRQTLPGVDGRRSPVLRRGLWDGLVIPLVVALPHVGAPSSGSLFVSFQVGSTQYHSPSSFTMFQAWSSRLSLEAPTTVMHSTPARSISSWKLVA